MGRKKHQRVMTLGGIRFATAKAAREWHQDRKHERIEIGRMRVHHTEEPLFGFLLDSFSRHPESDTIVGEGVVAFDYSRHAEKGWSDYGIIVHRVDGSVYRFPAIKKGWVSDWVVERGLDDFSAGFRSTQASCRQAVSLVMRWEISDDVREFREARTGSECDLCSEPVENGAEIDHEETTFANIRDEFLAVEHIDIADIRIETCPYSSDGARWLVDRLLADRWVVWHLERASLRYLHPQCHASITYASKPE